MSASSPSAQAHRGGCGAVMTRDHPPGSSTFVGAATFGRRPAGTISRPAGRQTPRFRKENTMKLNPFMKNLSVPAVASMLSLAMACAPVADARAAELQVLAGGGISAPLTELAAEFERTSGHKLVLRFGTTPELIKQVVGGSAFDLVVVPREVFKDAGALA